MWIVVKECGEYGVYENDDQRRLNTGRLRTEQAAKVICDAMNRAVECEDDGRLERFRRKEGEMGS